MKSNNFVSESYQVPGCESMTLGTTALWPETEIHGERASIAHRKVFARPESFCAGNFFLPISIENCLETLRSVWKVSGLSGELPDYLERF